MEEIRNAIRSGKSARFLIEEAAAELDPCLGHGPENEGNDCYSPHLSYHAPYVAYQWALGKGLITKEDYEQAREYHGRGWNYVGD